jgi:hypothetical protein
MLSDLIDLVMNLLHYFVHIDELKFTVDLNSRLFIVRKLVAEGGHH